MPNQKEEYEVLYSKFMEGYKRAQVSGEEVGELIARLAQQFAKFSLAAVSAERRRNSIAQDIESRTDEATGKPIASTKAKVFTRATDEYHDLHVARAHVANVEQYLNAMKALQKGVLNEYHHQ